MKRIIFEFVFALQLLFIIAGCEKEKESTQFPETEIISKGTVDTTLVIHSNILQIDVHYSVYLPPGYDTSNTDYPVFYLLHGMYGDHRDWVKNGLELEINSAISKGSAKPMVIIMPQAFNSFYCNNFNSQNFLYEDFMIQELLPHIEGKYRIKTIRNNTAIGGLSMGGYGATYHAFKRSFIFGSCYAMSAALPTVTGAPDIRELINQKTKEQIDSLPPIAFEVGTEDYLVYNGNVVFDTFLKEKGIPHTFLERPGTHDWQFWMTCLPKALTFISKYFD